MTESTPQTESLFSAALALATSEERARYLDRACGADQRLRAQVEQLLAAYPQVREFLESPPADLPPVLGHEGPRAGDTLRQPISERPGTVIGPYKLLQQIGEGGMGTVFMAEQTEPVQRKVALKIIKPGMDSKQVIARFEAERQALALMDHPNIARVLDADTTENGRPYFVMELVKGVPITKYCDEHRLTPKQRLALFVPVCQAVQHAHQKGIIHRDLKPSNVMVCLYDGKPVPKIIDFGVAKATGPKLTEHTLFTEFGQVVGTLEYMSPEQAELNQLDIDTRSDIYALGVLLFELLSGTTPLDRQRIKQSGMLEALRIIREEDAPTLSNRLATTMDLPVIAANRGLEPAKLTKLVRGELDWIVMKALEKDRNRRYESASAFAADVRRYLNDEPVLACPPSVWYRFRKFAGRNKTALVAATAVSLAVVVTVAGLAASTVFTARALTAQIDAKKEVERALEHERQTLYFQRIKTAARELTAKNLGRTEQSLDECIPGPGEPDLRGWEWHYLKRRRYQEPHELRDRYVVLSVAWSPNGLYMASGGLDGTVAVWNSHTWKPVYSWKGGDKGHANHVYGLAFSPDSRYLATAGDDCKVFVWDLTDGSRRYTLEGHHGTIRQLAFSPDGQRLASASEDKSVRLWDMNTGHASYIRAHDDSVRGVAFDAQGRLISASADGNVKVWDPATGAEAETVRARIRWISFMALHADSGQLALGSWDGTVELWDDLSAKNTRTLHGHTRHITSLAFSPNGRRLVSAGDDRGLIVWDTTAKLEALALDFGSLTPIGATFSADGLQLAVGCGQHCVVVYDGTPLSGNEKKDEVLTLSGHKDPVLRVAFSPDACTLVSASLDGTAKLWNALTGQELLTFGKHTALVSAVAFSPKKDVQRVASGSWDGTVLIWNPSNGHVEHILKGQAGFVHDVTFSPDGQRLASAHANGEVILWDVLSERPLWRRKAHGYEAVGVAFSPNGKSLATAGGRDHSAKIWDAATGEKVFPLDIGAFQRAQGRIWSIAFSPDAKLLATVGHGNLTGTASVLLWDAQTGTPLRPLEGQAGRNCSVAFSPDSRWIASSGWDEIVRVWELKTDKELRLSGHAGPVLHVTFTPDGRRLASCGGYRGRGEIKIWDNALWDKNP